MNRNGRTFVGLVVLNRRRLLAFDVTVLEVFAVKIDVHATLAVVRDVRALSVPPLEWASWHDARFSNGTPVEIKSTMHEHSDGQPGNWKVYREYHERLRRHDGWYCFVVSRPHGRSGCTILRDKTVRSSEFPLLRWPPWNRAGENLE